MMALLAGWALAADPTYERLFGETEPAVAAVVEVGPSVPMWIWPAALLGLGVVAASRIRGSLPKAPSAGLTILERQPAGDRSTLLVVEVADVQGVRRRLLVGTGTSAPALVADLGSMPSGTSTEATPVDVDMGPEEEELAPVRAGFAAALAAEVLAERSQPKPRFFADEDLAPLPPARAPRLPRDPVMSVAATPAKPPSPKTPQLTTPLLSTAPPRIALPPRVAPGVEGRTERTDTHRRFMRPRLGHR